MSDDRENVSDEDLSAAGAFYDRLMKHGQQKPAKGKHYLGEGVKHDDDSVVHETGGHRAHEGDHTPDSSKHPGSDLEARDD